jgi:hypothetical protein
VPPRDCEDVAEAATETEEKTVIAQRKDKAAYIQER